MTYGHILSHVFFELFLKSWPLINLQSFSAGGQTYFRIFEPYKLSLTVVWWEEINILLYSIQYEVLLSQRVEQLLSVVKCLVNFSLVFLDIMSSR